MIDEHMQELRKLSQELKVIVRVLEEKGIEFNRDEEGRVVGVVQMMSVTLKGEGRYGKA